MEGSPKHNILKPLQLLDAKHDKKHLPTKKGRDAWKDIP